VCSGRGLLRVIARLWRRGREVRWLVRRCRFDSCSDVVILVMRCDSYVTDSNGRYEDVENYIDIYVQHHNMPCSNLRNYHSQERNHTTITSERRWREVTNSVRSPTHEEHEWVIPQSAGRVQSLYLDPASLSRYSCAFGTDCWTLMTKTPQTETQTT
jgi:hypothetical protein